MLWLELHGRAVLSVTAELLAHVSSAAMRTHGWAGRPPADDAEARDRIIAATMECVHKAGPAKTSLADVAIVLGVTRQTVYRYFPSTEDLLAASADAAAISFFERLAGHVAQLRDPVEILAEAIVYTLDRLPKERYLGLLIAADRQAAFSAGINAKALAFAESVLRQFPIDWDAVGYGHEDLSELAEFMLRLFLSFAQPSEQPRRDRAALLAYLRRWLGPEIAALPVRDLAAIE